MKAKTTKQKIARMRAISVLCTKQRARIKNAGVRLEMLRRESVTVLRSIPKDDCALYAEKIARYVCAS